MRKHSGFGTYETHHVWVAAEMAAMAKNVGAWWMLG